MFSARSWLASTTWVGRVRLTFTVTRNYDAEPVREIVSRLIVPAEQLPRIALQLVGEPEREAGSHR